MTQNNYQDGAQFSAEGLDAQVNAHANEGVLSGGAPSIGTGSFEVDLTACDYVVSTTAFSIGADTVALSSPSGSDRVDIITATTGGAFNVTEGSPATDPNAPTIPTDEVLIAAVFVPSGASNLVSGNINDYRVFLVRDAVTFKGNDIDTDGDSKVDAADQADNADTLDTREATDLEDFSTTGDGSDITRVNGSQSQSGTTTVVNVSGSGFLLGGVYTVNGPNASVDVTIDGGTTQSFNNTVVNVGDANYIGYLPQIKYESSLLVEAVGASGEASRVEIVYK